ncbi:hypothetical protein [Saliniramus sp.]|uniref:hypothetical protein n=1 Tax=Saliniramus sp. TaxID=2986772 RepID=UPI002CFCF8D7|nr:hypothetical protein [Saliniramus sp.]HMB11035.1 hypothetical protein [Saliniramus sp.]
MQIIPAPETMSPRIQVLHDNDAWVVPLRVAFEERSAFFTERLTDRGGIDPRATLPAGARRGEISHRYRFRHTAESASGKGDQGQRYRDSRHARDCLVSARSARLNSREDAAAGLFAGG